MTGHQVGLLLFLIAALVIAVSNRIILPRLEQHAITHPPAQVLDLLRVSILVPARDEERNIATCVNSLLAQDYPDFEVLVLDDHSTDATGDILAEIARREPRLRVLSGAPLPEGWLGKHWACHQLAQSATGEALLFTDADTIHHRSALQEAVQALQAEELGFLTAWPYQQTKTWGERLIVPLIYWSFLSFVPLILAYRIRLPGLSAAIGQFMLFHRQAYEQIGGFAAIRSNTADDLALARLVKAQRLPWKILNATGRVSCRMYHNFQEAFQGLSKNLFAAFDYRLLPFGFVWLWLGIVFLEPPVVLAIGAVTHQVPGVNLFLAGLAIVLAIVLWLLTLSTFHFPLVVAIFYPICVLLGVLIAARSLFLTLEGEATWKGRVVTRNAVRWW